LAIESRRLGQRHGQTKIPSHVIVRNCRANGLSLVDVSQGITHAIVLNVKVPPYGQQWGYMYAGHTSNRVSSGRNLIFQPDPAIPQSRYGPPL
jgi:hypothetical protein